MEGGRGEGWTGSHNWRRHFLGGWTLAVLGAQGCGTPGREGGPMGPGEKGRRLKRLPWVTQVGDLWQYRLLSTLGLAGHLAKKSRWEGPRWGRRKWLRAGSPQPVAVATGKAAFRTVSADLGGGRGPGG